MSETNSTETASIRTSTCLHSISFDGLSSFLSALSAEMATAEYDRCLCRALGNMEESKENGDGAVVLVSRRDELSKPAVPPPPPPLLLLRLTRAWDSRFCFNRWAALTYTIWCMHNEFSNISLLQDFYIKESHTCFDIFSIRIRVASIINPHPTLRLTILWRLVTKKHLTISLAYFFPRTPACSPDTSRPLWPRNHRRMSRAWRTTDRGPCDTPWHRWCRHRHRLPCHMYGSDTSAGSWTLSVWRWMCTALCSGTPHPVTSGNISDRIYIYGY